MLLTLLHSLTLFVFLLALAVFQLAGGFFAWGVQANALLVAMGACAYLSRTADGAFTPFLFALGAFAASMLFLSPWFSVEMGVLAACALGWSLAARGLRTGTPLADFLVGLLAMTLGFYGILAFVGEGRVSFLFLLQEIGYTMLLGIFLFFSALHHAIRSFYA